MPKAKRRYREVIPQQIATGLVNSFGWSITKNNDIMTIEFQYSPAGNARTETFARVHLTEASAEAIREALDDFLAKAKSKGEETKSSKSKS